MNGELCDRFRARSRPGSRSVAEQRLNGCQVEDGLRTQSWIEEFRQLARGRGAARLSTRVGGWRPLNLEATEQPFEGDPEVVEVATAMTGWRIGADLYLTESGTLLRARRAVEVAKPGRVTLFRSVAFFAPETAEFHQHYLSLEEIDRQGLNTIEPPRRRLDDLLLATLERLEGSRQGDPAEAAQPR